VILSLQPSKKEFFDVKSSFYYIPEPQMASIVLMIENISLMEKIPFDAENTFIRKDPVVDQYID
jgi:hypothetical protein